MKMIFVGDVMLGRLVNQMLRECEAAYPWGNTLPLFQEADLRICNLECVLSNRGTPWLDKMFHFRSDEKNVKTLQAAKIDMVSLANNHVLDYEYEALFGMLDLLDQEKILRSGAGRNAQEASKPAICQVKGEKVGLLAFTDNEPGWEAQRNKPGVFFVPIDLRDQRAQELLKRVKLLRQEVDFVIVSAHWGPNWGYEPPEEHVVFAHALIDAGADLIFGHSGHIFRGIEIYKNRPIIYCAGDFIDDYAVDEVEKNDESFIFLFEKGRLKLYPTQIHEFQARLASPYRKKEILSKMQELCGKLGTPIQCFADYALVEF